MHVSLQTTSYRFGKTFGFLASYFVFTTLVFLLFMIRHAAIKYWLAMLITAVISFFGYSLKRWLS